MRTTVIALAGSPTSGKSSVLRALKELDQSENIKVLFLDEMATVFLHNRPEEVSALDSQLLRQHYILRGQIYSEELLLNNAVDPVKPTLIITDRGSVDAMVYLEDDEFLKLKVDPETLYSRYDHVIFLEGSRENFRYDPTTTRLESNYDEISARGERSYTVWSKHPSFSLITQQDTVEMKIKLVVDRINELMRINVFNNVKIAEKK